MKKIEPKDLSAADINTLATKQATVNLKTNFSKKSNKAASLWTNKKGTSAKKSAFDEIEKKLKKAILPNGYCHYCEHNEASEIEHICPKSYFPEQTFVWENYLFICGECNRTKLAHFRIFNATGSNNIQELPNPVKGSPAFQPPTTDICFIQSRLENPMEYLLLDLKTGIFIELPILEEATSVPEKRHRAKAEQTRKILDLNREILRKSRQNVATHYKVQLEYAAKIANSNSTPQLKNKLPDYFQECLTKIDFPARKSACLNLVKSNVQKHPYGNPTVWEEIKRQYFLYPDDLAAWFAACPDALNW